MNDFTVPFGMNNYNIIGSKNLKYETPTLKVWNCNPTVQSESSNPIVTRKLLDFLITLFRKPSWRAPRCRARYKFNMKGHCHRVAFLKQLRPYSISFVNKTILYSCFRYDYIWFHWKMLLLTRAGPPGPPEGSYFDSSGGWNFLSGQNFRWVWLEN